MIPSKLSHVSTPLPAPEDEWWLKHPSTPLNMSVWEHPSEQLLQSNPASMAASQSSKTTSLQESKPPSLQDPSLQASLQTCMIGVLSSFRRSSLLPQAPTGRHRPSNLQPPASMKSTNNYKNPPASKSMNPLKSMLETLIFMKFTTIHPKPNESTDNL